MAIQKDLLSSEYGVPFVSAYFRIVSVLLSRVREEEGKHHFIIDVAGYATNPLRINTREVELRRYRCPASEIDSIEGESFLSKCYTWVMAQEDMNNSEAV